MTNAELISKIKAEIERQMDEYKPIVGGVDELTGAHIVLAKLLSFLDTLEEETPNDLEEAAGLYLDNHKPLTRYNWGDLMDAFKAGAKWQAEKYLSLTWRDIMVICEHYVDVNYEYDYHSIQEKYEEILRRFKEAKK